MEITVTGKHLEITPAIREYAETKANKMTKYFDRIMAIEVVLDTRERQQHEVEMIVHVEHHEPFVARAKDSDLYATIDDVADKMERQLTDFKEKRRNRKHPASR